MAKKSYTLIELVIVIGVLAMLAVSVVVYTGFYKKIQLDSAAQEVAADIRHAQSLAMSTTTWYGIVFYPSPGNYYSVYTTNGTIDSIIKKPESNDRDYTINLSSDYGISITSVNIGGGSKVEFNPLGTPYADKNGSPIAGTNNTIILSAGGVSKTIRISETSGRVYIE